MMTPEERAEAYVILQKQRIKASLPVALPVDHSINPRYAIELNQI